MSPIVHLDPRGMHRLLALGETERRLFLTILAEAPDGELRGAERRLARLAGVKGEELRAALLALAATTPPLIEVRATPDGIGVRLAANPDLIVRHTTGVSARGPRAAAPAPLAASLDGEMARLEAELALLEADLPRLLRAWIAHLAELGGGSLERPLALLQWTSALRISGLYGPEILRLALEAGIKNVRTLGSHPERYLLAAARGSAEGGRAGIAKNDPLDEVPF